MAQVLNVNVGFDSFDELRSALFANIRRLRLMVVWSIWRCYRCFGFGCWRNRLSDQGFLSD
jgi:hypothetical protein